MSQQCNITEHDKSYMAVQNAILIFAIVLVSYRLNQINKTLMEILEAIQ